MEGNCKINEVVYKYDVIKPLSKSVSLTWEDGRAISITKVYYSNTRNIPIRQKFQVTCGT